MKCPSNLSIGYRYAFNGKEKDDEIKGSGNSYDYGARIYDSRLGRFLSVDPLSFNYSYKSTYDYAENDVLRSSDLDGKEKDIKTLWYAGKSFSDVTALVKHTADLGVMFRATQNVVKANKLPESGMVQVYLTDFNEYPFAVSYIYIDEKTKEAKSFVIDGSTFQKEMDKASGDLEREADIQTAIDLWAGGSKYRGPKGTSPKMTSRAARRQAMREANIPTSQPLIEDKLSKGKVKGKVYTTRDKQHSVQDAKSDVSHPDEPHWEAGKTKKDPSSPDGLNRSGTNNKPQLQNEGKAKVNYDDKKD